jgi:methionyl-tRNA formyltransferase
MRVLFFGSDSSSLVALRALWARREHGALRRLDVVCPAAKVTGRGARARATAGAVRSFAEERGLRVFDAPERAAGPPRRERGVALEDPLADKAWRPAPEAVREDYDLGVVVSFGYFLPRQLIEAFPRGALNVHPSLLPRYRGAAPVQRCLINGDARTGVSVIKVDPLAFDAGAVLAQSEVVVGAEETFAELCPRLLELGTRDLLAVMDDLAAAEAAARPQGAAKGEPRAFKLTEADRIVDPARHDAQAVWNRWRATVANGGAFSHLGGGKRVLLLRLRLPLLPELATMPHGEALEPGSLLLGPGGRLFLRCAGGGLVECLELQVEGSKPLLAHDFANGYCRGALRPRLQLPGERR